MEGHPYQIPTTTAKEICSFALEVMVLETWTTISDPLNVALYG